ncbi:NUDIX hydrolase 6-like protein [Tanacetum coccineum]
MAETMEQYISKTRTDYGSGVARPKIDNKDQFKLKGKFLKELQENTFRGSDNEDANEHIEKVLKIVDLFHVPNITFLNKYCPPGRTAKKMEEINNFQQEPDETLYQAWERFKELLMKCPQHYLTEMQEVILFYNGTSRGRSAETSDGLAAMQAQLNNLGREIKKVNEKVYDAQVGCEQCKGPYYTKDCPQKEEGKTLEEAYYTCCHTEPRSIDQNFRNSNRANKQADLSLIRRIGSNQYAISTGQNSTLLYKSRQTTILFPSHLEDHYCEEEGNYGPKFMEAYEASHINSAIPQKEKDPGSFTLPCFINDFCFDNAFVNLGASVSVMPFLTYLNLGLDELAHTRLTVELADRTVKYPKGIAENVLVGIGKFIFPIDFIILDMTEDINAKIMDLQEKYYFKILEDMDAYRDEGIGNVIVGEPFLREVGIIAKQFDGMITIYNGNDEVTYQMVRSRLRFKNHTNKQCNKILPLLKVSEVDKMNGISHAYQKLKRFYKGVLNLGTDYIRNVKTEEWLTRGHINVHEME